MSQKNCGENGEKWGNFLMTVPKFPMISFPILCHWFPPFAHINLD